MTAWRGVCRQCSELTVEGRAWCRACLDRIRVTGVSDFHETPTYDEARKAGAPGRDTFATQTRGRRG